MIKLLKQMDAWYLGLLILFIVEFCFAQLIQPENGTTLSRIHVLFEWQQVQYADSYRLQICEDNSFEICSTDTTDVSLMLIVRSGIDWNSEYFWRTQPVFPGGIKGDWSEPYSFSTFSPLGQSYSIINNENLLQNGITIFGAFFDFYSAAIDKTGKEVWNSGEENFVYYNINAAGQIFGSMYRPQLQNNLPGVHYSIQNEIIWQEPNDHFLHHDFLQLPDGNYMGIVEDQGYGPIPYDACIEYETAGSCDYATLFQLLGYTVDGETADLPWIGDRIVVWDNSGEEIWSWSTFDNFDMVDFDRIGGSWTEAYSNMRYDWTHCNALWFDEQESMIYLSSRHLSRITKIAYPSGEIIWNMGLNMPSGDVNFGNDLGYSYQHSLQVLDNGHILTLDNGNLSTTLLDTDYPTTRALEIKVINNQDAEIIWEYNLPENLFGFASGNVQKMDNGNYLITTVGGGGTSLEVTEQHEIVWEGKYNLTLPSGAVYRANRIPGLYAGEFSLRLPKNTNFDFYNTLIYNSESLEYLLVNKSNYITTYDVSIELYNAALYPIIYDFEVTLNPHETVDLHSVPYIYPYFVNLDGNIHPIIFTISPGNNIHKQKTFQLFWAENDSVAAPRFVYPGDTDNNGVVDEHDILPIGIFYNEPGFARETTTFNWIGHPALKWNEEAVTFADANGDGIVDARDVIGIGVNWGNTHAASGQEYTVNELDLEIIEMHREAFMDIYYSLAGEGEAVAVMKLLLENILQISAPNDFSLNQNFPNPFNAATTIPFYLPEQAKINLMVFDLSGRQISNLIQNQLYPAGESIIQWNAEQIPSGVYFYNLETPDWTQTQKMILIK